MQHIHQAVSTYRQTRPFVSFERLLFIHKTSQPNAKTSRFRRNVNEIILIVLIPNCCQTYNCCHRQVVTHPSVYIQNGRPLVKSITSWREKIGYPYRCRFCPVYGDISKRESRCVGPRAKSEPIVSMPVSREEHVCSIYLRGLWCIRQQVGR